MSAISFPQQPLPPQGPVTVNIKLTGSTETNANYTLEFTNISFKLVCQIKFRVQLPKTSTLATHWNMDLISGTTNQFILPKSVHLYPAQCYTAAGISVNGVDRPEIVDLDVKSILSTEKPDANKD